MKYFIEALKGIGFVNIICILYALDKKADTRLYHPDWEKYKEYADNYIKQKYE